MTRSASTSNHRGQWSSSVEFLLSCVSMCVGLGNVWRFPYVAYENGGGAFLIPYLLLLFVVGRPMYYLEMIVGQFTSSGPIDAWRCVPALRGLAFAQLFSIAYVAIFYNYLMSISAHYFIGSFSRILPWTVCDDSWFPNINNNNNNLTKSCVTEYVNGTATSSVSLPELYYLRHILNISRGLWDINSINWSLVCALAAVWTLVFVSIVRGVRSLGKVSYFTAIFPYFVLITLLTVAAMEDGAAEGVAFFFTPRFERLLDPIVWYRACEQSFFSLTVCFGSLIMYSSYNRFDHKVHRDCLIISALDTATSVLAGSVVFAVLGTMAKRTGVRIEDVVSSGSAGLAFVVYPEALSKIRWGYPQIWSAMFFAMLLALGIGSSVGMVETILTTIKDRHPTLCRRHSGKTAFVVCVCFFALGLPLTTDAGSYIMSLLDNYGVGTAAFLYGICEICGFVWIYGLRNLCDDAHFMLGFSVAPIWRLLWSIVTPVVLIIIFIYGNVLLFLNPSTRSTTMPWWGVAIGWSLAVIALAQIPLWFVIEFCRRCHVKSSATLKQRLRSMFRPDADYGPAEEKTFQLWLQWKLDRRRKVTLFDDHTGGEGQCDHFFRIENHHQQQQLHHQQQHEHHFHQSHLPSQPQLSSLPTYKMLPQCSSLTLTLSDDLR